jgi:hypothetical protein
VRCHTDRVATLNLLTVAHDVRRPAFFAASLLGYFPSTTMRKHMLKTCGIQTHAAEDNPIPSHRRERLVLPLGHGPKQGTGTA